MKKKAPRDVSAVEEPAGGPAAGAVGETSGSDTHVHMDPVEAAMQQHEAALLRYAARILNDAVAAQDVVQNAFIKFFRKFGFRHGRSDGEVKAWLYRVTHNEAVDAIRRESRLRRLHEEQAEETALQGDGRATGVPIDEKRELVLALVRKLQPREQQVLLLRMEEGLSYREISRVTGRSEGNVGNILHHAVKKLSRLLAAEAVID